MIVNVLFYVFGAILVITALGVITARNPVHCALFLVAAFLNSAVIWLLLEAEFLAVARRHAPAAKPPVRVERFAFYERAKSAYACVITGETRKYGNLIVKKGVTPC